MLWRRSEPLKLPRDLPPTIPGSDSVRQAALQASWRRDRRVAQRRIAWRWTVWYLQRFSPHVLTGMALLVGAAYFSGSLLSWPGHADRAEMADSTLARAPYSPPSVPTAPVITPLAEPPTVPDSDVPLTLRASLALGATAIAPPPAPETRISPDTLTLKPENWLHSKEP
jgi:hypothetical protein